LGSQNKGRYGLRRSQVFGQGGVFGQVLKSSLRRTLKSPRARRFAPRVYDFAVRPLPRDCRALEGPAQLLPPQLVILWQKKHPYAAYQLQLNFADNLPVYCRVNCQAFLEIEG
jgi:hypothetical protein